MEVESKYIAPSSDAFAALMQAPELAGFLLEPLPPAHLLDVYLDTGAADLLRLGYAFRIREQGAEVLATLKSLGGAAGALHRRLELEAALGGPLEDGRLPHIPGGPLREALDELVGDAPLRELTRIQQYRTPRVAFEGARLVGVLSLDVVAHLAERGPHVTNEVEVELAEGGREEDLYRLDPVLRARGLEPAARSKFERAVLRLRNGPGAPVLLLPDERAALDRLADDGTPLHRRRARVVLLAARALRTETIANKVGLSPSRVRHWVETFRERRMDIFEPGPERGTPLLSRRAVPGYRVSELVTAGTPTPPLFRHEHFDEGDVAGDEATAAPVFWDGIHDTDPRPVRTRDESVEFDRVPVDSPVTEAAGDGAPARRPLRRTPEVRDRPRDAPDVKAVLADDAPMGWGVGARDGDLDPDTLAIPPAPDVGGVPPVSLDHLVPEDVASLDELLDLFDGAPVATPRLGRDLETVGISLIEEEPDPLPLLAFTGASEATEDAAPQRPETAAAVRTTRTGARARPSFEADEPVLVAADRVLTHARDFLFGAAARLAAERDAAAVRRALVASHRVRIGFELFEDYLPVRPVRRLHRGLRPTARALDGLSDLDVLCERLAEAQGAAGEASSVALGTAFEAVHRQREEALEAVLARLDGGAHTLWLTRYDRLLDHLAAQIEAGLDLGRPEGFDDYVDVAEERPARARVRHMLGSALWSRYEALRAYDPVVASADPESERLLYPLGVACAALQYLIGLASGCSGEAARPASDALAAVERPLVALHQLRASADALRPHAEAPPVGDLRRRLDAHADEARAELASRWADVAAPSFREALARVLVGIGGS